MRLDAVLRVHLVAFGHLTISACGSRGGLCAHRFSHINTVRDRLHGLVETTVNGALLYGQSDTFTGHRA